MRETETKTADVATGETVRHFLRSGDDDVSLSEPNGGAMTSVHALTFGHLADLAAPIVTRYRSDLFHDAQWIARNVTVSGAVFYFGCDESGTAIGLDGGPVACSRPSHVWRVELVATRDSDPVTPGRVRRFDLDVTPLDGPTMAAAWSVAYQASR